MRKALASFVIALALGIAGAAFAGPVNINTADAKTLAKELDGVGLEKAKAIVEFREKNGLFRSADDLLKVVGIGPATVERNRARIVVDKNQVAKVSPSGN